MPELLVRIKRAPDGSAALTCVRADGSRTWQRQTGAYALVFPTHDLTHFAVETTLGYAHGFFGLVADGWDIGDFAQPWPRGPIPQEAREVELLVGLFDMEHRMGGWNAAEMQAQAETYIAGGKGGVKDVRVPRLTDDDIERVRAARAELFDRWDATKPGETLELPFTRSTGARA